MVFEAFAVSARESRAGRTTRPLYSVVVPLYKNEPTLGALVSRPAELGGELDAPLEVVFVVDGSPDASLFVLRRLLPPGRLVRLAHVRERQGPARRDPDDA